MIQIDMPMPTNCFDCPACNEYLICAIPVNGRKWGENDVHEFCQGRPEWCPMKEQETVVRCKDCTHWDKGHTEECDNPDSICFHNGWCNLDWFCPRGERRS